MTDIEVTMKANSRSSALLDKTQSSFLLSFDGAISSVTECVSEIVDTTTETEPIENLGFLEMGLDSIDLFELSRLVKSDYNGIVEISSTVAFDYPTIFSLASHLHILILNYFIIGYVDEIIGVNSETEINENLGFIDMGMDTMELFELSRLVKSMTTGIVEISATIAFDYPTISSLSSYLHNLIKTETYVSFDDVISSIIECLSEILLLSSETKIDQNSGFIEMGMDFMERFEFSMLVKDRFKDKVEISSTVAFDCPTMFLIASHLHKLIRTKTFVEKTQMTSPTSGSEITELSMENGARMHQIDRLANLPLSLNQQQMFFLNQYEVGSLHLYNEHSLISINRNQWNGSVIHSVLNILVQENSSLRTRFPIKYDACQEILSMPETSISTDLGHHRLNDMDLIIESYYGFDLSVKVACRCRSQTYCGQLIISICQHHIITDYTSFVILSKQMLDKYRLLLISSDSICSRQQFHYADYSIIQREFMKSAEIEKQLRYWCEALNNSEDLNFPLDIVRPLQLCYMGNQIDISISNTLSKQIAFVAEAIQFTQFTVTLAVFAQLLQEIACQSNVLFGTILSGRYRSSIQNVIGYFVNTLPLPFYCQPESFIQIFDDMKDIVKCVFENKNVPYSEIVNATHAQRQSNKQALCRVMLHFINMKEEHLNTNKDTTEDRFLFGYIPVYLNVSRLDWSFTLFSSQSRVVSALNEYSTELFYSSTMLSTSTKYLQLLRTSYLSFQSMAYSLQLFENNPNYSTRVRSYVSNSNNICSNMHGTAWIIITRQQSLCPQRVLSKDDQSLIGYLQSKRVVEIYRKYAYGSISKRWALGTFADQVIVVQMDRTAHSILLCNFASISGLTFVAVSSQIPTSRQTVIATDSKARIVASQAYFNRIKAIGSVQTTRILNPVQTEKDLLYAVYTSGSTGVPKGIAITNKNIINYIFSSWYFCETDTVFLHNLSFAFDASLGNTFISVASGSSIIISETSLEPLAKLKRNQATTCEIAVACLNSSSPTALIQVSKLELIGHGGDIITKEAHMALANYSVCKINRYGPAEATVETAAKRGHIFDAVNSVSPPSKLIVEIRHFISGVLVRNGVPAELVISGSSVARGYFSHKELSSIKFVSFPPMIKEQELKYGKMSYKSGDIGKYCPDGMVQIYGRKDFQVKLRGQRIELSEIEQVALTHSDVRQSAAVIVGESDVKKRILLYYSSTNILCTCSSLLSYLARNLPEYMIPSKIIKLDDLPLSAAGKFDRQQLVVMSRELKDYATSVSNIPAPTEIERIIIKCWEKYLDISNISVNDNFFALGGNSLNAVTIVNLMQRQTKRDYAVHDLFKNPTIRQIANLDQAIAKEIVITKANYLSLLPLSYNQEQMLFLFHQNIGDNHLYHMIGLWSWPLSCNMMDYEHTFCNLLQKQSSCRTIYSAKGMTQYILSATEVYPKCSSVIEIPQRQIPIFDRFASLERKPPITVFHFLVNVQHIMLVAHHILIDAWSGSIVESHMIESSAHHHFNVMKSSHLDFQYVDFALWQKNYVSGENLDKLISFWKMYWTADDTVFSLTNDKAAHNLCVTTEKMVTFFLSELYSERISMMAEAVSCTQCSTLLANLLIVLHHFVPSKMITLGCLSANRVLAEFNNTVGYFLNNFVLQSDPNIYECSFEDIARHTQDMMILGNQHQDLPYALLVDSLKPAKTVDDQHLFTILFNYRYNLEVVPTQIRRLFETLTQNGELDVVIAIDEFVSLMNFEFFYASEKFYRHTITSLTSHFFNCCGVLIRYCTQKLLYMSATKEFINSTTMSILKRKTVDIIPNNIALIFRNQILLSPGKVFAKDTELCIQTQQMRMITTKFSRVVHQSTHVKMGLKSPTDQSLLIQWDYSVQSLLAYYAAIESGLMFTTVLFQMPIERRNFITTQVKARLVIVEQTANYVCSKARIFQQTGKLDKLGREQTLVDALYCIFTSGTTGKPKGIVVSNKNVLNWMSNAVGAGMYYFCTNDSSLLQSLNFSYDGSLVGFFLSLVSGTTIIVCENHLEPLSMFASSNATIVPIATSILNSSNSRLLARLSMHEFVYHGGDLLSKQVHHQLAIESIDQLNQYGPSECTIEVAIQRGHVFDDVRNIGCPFSPLLTSIRDFTTGVSVPNGVPAELVISGASVSRGYFKDNLETEGFVSLAPRTEIRLRHGDVSYKTGDIAKFSPDGSLLIYGRIDSQVKLRGQRIELNEIEQVAMINAHVREAVSVLIGESDHTKAIVLYILADTQAHNNDVQTMLVHLSKHLPRYMLPSDIVVLNKMPLDSSGKIDRMSLSKREIRNISEYDEDDLKNQYMNISTEFEGICNVISGVWGKVLGHSNFGYMSNFFEVGGNSIRALQVFEMIKETGNIKNEDKINYFFHCETIYALAGKITRFHEAAYIYDTFKYYWKWSPDRMYYNVFDYGVDTQIVVQFYNYLKMAKYTDADIWTIDELFDLQVPYYHSLARNAKSKYSISTMKLVKLNLLKCSMFCFQHFEDTCSLQCIEFCQTLSNMLSIFSCRRNAACLRTTKVSDLSYSNVIQEQLYNMLKLFGETFTAILCGHSDGGKLAYYAAISQEQQFNISRCVILLDTMLDSDAVLQNRMEYSICFNDKIASIVEFRTLSEVSHKSWTMHKLFMNRNIGKNRQKIYFFKSLDCNSPMQGASDIKCDKPLSMSLVCGNHWNMMRKSYNEMLCQKINAIVAEQITMNSC